MQNLKANEVSKISGGMCNCVAGSSGSSSSSYTVASVGLVTYANVCKDLVSNATVEMKKHWSDVEVVYLGCYPQDEEGLLQYSMGER